MKLTLKYLSYLQLLSHLFHLLIPTKAFSLLLPPLWTRPNKPGLPHLSLYSTVARMSPCTLGNKAILDLLSCHSIFFTMLQSGLREHTLEVRTSRHYHTTDVVLVETAENKNSSFLIMGSDEIGGSFKTDSQRECFIPLLGNSDICTSKTNGGAA